MSVSVFGQLEKIDKFAELSYKNKGTIIRFLKAAGSVAVSALVVAAAQGTLFPAEWSPAIVIVLTAGLQAADKWFRENTVEKEALAEGAPPLTENTPDEVGVDQEEETFDSEVLSETEETEGQELSFEPEPDDVGGQEQYDPLNRG